MPDFTALKQEAQRFGWIKTAYRIVMDRLGSVMQLYQISSRLLDPEAPPQPTPADLRIATYKELLAAAEQMPNQLTVEFIDSALARGDICWGAFLDGKMVSFGWRAYQSTPHTEDIWVRVQPPFRYGYKSYTRPEYRGMRVRDSTRSDSHCASLGRTRGIGFIATHNFASLNRSKRQTTRIFHGYAGYLIVFGKPRFFRSLGVRKIGFEFYLNN
ncbi:MAG: hypothetical protein GKR90_10910 [Pseudomonadales bacterium]|nr:hypothetical protein [Pseudomonadales bacterium]